MCSLPQVLLSDSFFLYTFLRIQTTTDHTRNPGQMLFTTSAHHERDTPSVPDASCTGNLPDADTDQPTQRRSEWTNQWINEWINESMKHPTILTPIESSFFAVLSSSLSTNFHCQYFQLILSSLSNYFSNQVSTSSKYLHLHSYTSHTHIRRVSAFLPIYYI